MKKNGKCVVIRMSGGLGNQLFQVFAGLYVAKIYGINRIDLDCRFLNSYQTSRKLEVDFLLKHIPNMHINKSLSIFPKILSALRIAKLFNINIFGLYFLNSIKSISHNCRISNLFFLDGYFQEQPPMENALDRKIFFKNLVSDYAYLLKKNQFEISRNMVAIHIRRGDYITSKAASKTFRTIDLDYYRRAIQKFSVNSQFLVFGDDPEINALFANEISGCNVGDFHYNLAEEFMLMSMCDHYIIANSTFSWSAAYLGYNQSKRVISPRNWYVDQDRSLNNPLLMQYFELLD